MIRKIFVVCLLITSTALVAQRNSSSPYSFFGIGERYSPRTVEQNSMGGIGVAYNHYKYLNFTNPAANAFLRETTYTLGALNTNLTVKTANSSQSSLSTSLNYLALGFPIGESAGFSFGLQPISSIGYVLLNESFNNAGELEAVTAYNGNGGVSRIYGSFGIKLTKEFALGLEADFSFGNSENLITNQRDNVALATRYEEDYNLRGNSIKLGAQYKKDIKDNLHVDAGASVKLGNDLNVSGNEFLYSLTINAGGEVSRDTLSNTALNGKYRFPIKSVFGIGIGKYDKWYVGAEYENQDAIEAIGINNSINAYRYEGSNRISLGGFYLPKINSISSYWNRITYRAGLKYENVGLAVDGTGLGTNFTSIEDFGISFGLGLPLKRLSSVNLGLEYGKRGTTANNLIQENYFNFRLSLSLSERWFIKRKID
ncbi:hypothetical protein [uncultured Polaribacter sp.]|uniref:hypothetical protein n=1 Tax=uncultured Polaribacter sp. TaxID=174711 RepID=UPI00260633C1|nr:hypothetical protein [uncultured Polaribacter sp.]